MVSDKSVATEQRLNALVNGLFSGGTPTIVNQGAPTVDAHQGAPGVDTNQGAAGASYSQAFEQAQTDRINHILNNNISGDLTSAINRINDILDTNSGDLTAVINRVNQILNVLRAAGMIN